MRITPVIEGMVIPQVTGVVRRSRSGPVSRGRACPRTGQAPGRGASGCGFRCRKRPGRESTAPPRRWSALSLELRVNTHRAFESASPAFLRDCAPCRTSLRSEADFFPTQVAVWQLFPALPLRSPPLHSIALRSSGGELRGAPLSVNLLG